MLERLVFAITNAALRSRRRELAASPDTVVSEVDSEVWRQKIGRIDLMLDSSGRAIFGEGEWAAVKHGGRGVRGWKKLDLGVDSGDAYIETWPTPVKFELEWCIRILLHLQTAGNRQRVMAEIERRIAVEPMPAEVDRRGAMHGQGDAVRAGCQFAK